MLSCGIGTHFDSVYQTTVAALSIRQIDFYGQSWVDLRKEASILVNFLLQCKYWEFKKLVYTGVNYCTKSSLSLLHCSAQLPQQEFLDYHSPPLINQVLSLQMHISNYLW